MQFRNKLAAVAATVASAALTVPAFAATGPSAGDLSGLTPDAATILTAIAAVGVISLGVVLAIAGFHIVKRMLPK